MQWVRPSGFHQGRSNIGGMSFQKPNIRLFSASLSPSGCTLPFLPCTEALGGLPVNRYSLLLDRKLTHDKMHQFSARWVRWTSSQGLAESCSWHRRGVLWTGAGEERQLWAKCSSCLWKNTVKQQVSPTLLLIVILLQVLSMTKLHFVATMTLKHWHTLSLCQAHTSALYFPEPYLLLSEINHQPWLP